MRKYISPICNVCVLKIILLYLSSRVRFSLLTEGIECNEERSLNLQMYCSFAPKVREETWFNSRILPQQRRHVTRLATALMSDYEIVTFKASHRVNSLQLERVVSNLSRKVRVYASFRRNVCEIDNITRDEIFIKLQSIKLSRLSSQNSRRFRLSLDYLSLCLIDKSLSVYSLNGLVWPWPKCRANSSIMDDARTFSSRI